MDTFEKVIEPCKVALRDCTNSQNLKKDKEYKCIILDETESDIPEPFIFPKFPMDVALQLQKGEITARAYRELISGVSRAMFTFKRHPIAGVSEAIRSRFKEYNRKPSATHESQLKMEDEGPKAKKRKCLPKTPVTSRTTKFAQMDHGEDRTSYERNETMLKSQYNKKDVNEDVIKKLMELTWEGRHHNIYSNPMDVLQLLAMYPYLSEKDYILHEFSLISQKTIDLSVWSSWKERITKLASRESKIMNELKYTDDDEEVQALKQLIALMSNRKKKNADNLRCLCCDVPENLLLEEASQLLD